jgi:hypothetical protein
VPPCRERIGRAATTRIPRTNAYRPRHRLAAKTQQRLVRLRFEIVAAQVQAASGKASDLQAAGSALDVMIREMEEIQMLSDLFEARFARGDIEMKYGNRADGRTRLAAVEKEAASSGFALSARKAAQAANQSETK